MSMSWENTILNLVNATKIKKYFPLHCLTPINVSYSQFASVLSLDYNFALCSSWSLRLLFFELLGSYPFGTFSFHKTRSFGNFKAVYRVDKRQYDKCRLAGNFEVTACAELQAESQRQSPRIVETFCLLFDARLYKSPDYMID